MNIGKIKQKIQDVQERLLSLLYPNVCPFCGNILKEQGLICSKCEFLLPYIDEPRCKKCGKPLLKEQQEYCWDCEHHKHYYDRGFSVWVHQPIVAQAIYQFKYHNRRIYSRLFAEQMVKSYYSFIIQWNIDLIVPIPISKKRKRKRGFNQAELLAQEISRITGIPYNAGGLKRKRETVPQKSLSVNARRENLHHAFAWEGGPLPEKILLVDDIYTTGNTINMAAKILKKEGAKNVYFITISIGQGY